MVTLAVFQHLCEAFVGIHPSVALLRHFFRPRVEAGRFSGAVTWTRRQRSSSTFIAMEHRSKWEEWRRDCCFVRFPEADDSLGVPMEGPVAMDSWECVEDRDVELALAINRIEVLHHLGLTGRHVVLDFLRCAVAPLQLRSHPMWAVPESSAAGERRSLGRSKPWADLTREDFGDGSDDEVDISDIVFARQSLDALEENRRSFAATLRMEQRQFVASREFLVQQRHEVMVARDELSRTRAELERRGAILEECEHGLAQREAAIDASGTAEQLQQQLTDLRAELDAERARFDEERRERMAEWHKSMATHEEQIRTLESQVRDLQSTNEGLRKELADAAALADRERHISRNSALEFERQMEIARAERNKAQENERKSLEELQLACARMMKFQTSRDEARTKAEALGVDLVKARKEHMLHLDELEKVQKWVAATMQELGLVAQPLQDRSIHSIALFFTNLSGQLRVLPELLEARALNEGRQIIDATARLILPRVHHLAPGFPFNALLDEFATSEEEREATAAVEPVINEVKEAAKRG